MRNAAPIVALILALGLCSGSGYAAGEDTPAIRKIEQARKAIAAKPAQAEPYNELAQALAGRARETGDTGYYVQAQQAIDQAVRLSPDNLDSEKASIRVLLGQQEFGQALERARALNKKVPDDVLVYGFIVDAASETGLYAEAERAVQWMLDLRSGNIAGLMRAAYMREMFGDVDGATELMQAALQRLPPHETEERAWTMNRIAHLRLAAGKPAEAEPFAREALALFPGYHYALGTLASIKLAQNQPTEALALERQRYQTAPNAGNLYSLAQALRRSGRAQEARNAFAEFEKKALSKSGDADNSNRALVHYYVDVARKPTQALRVATLELARRRDVLALDAHAWALYANGNYAAARRQLDSALAVGIRDAGMLYHAGAIASKLKDRKSAARYLQQSLALAPDAAFAAPARKLLAQSNPGMQQFALSR